MELMVALALTGLLAAVGIPGYNAYVNRARVAVAISDIGSMSATLYRWELATRKFPETLAEVGLDGRVDPWGNAYRYLNVETANPSDVRRDRNLRPINTDFDLYSVGPDGQTQTQLLGAKAHDDVIRASNGQFIGLAQDY
jgi:general secretion pathway protein G